MLQNDDVDDGDVDVSSKKLSPSTFDSQLIDITNSAFNVSHVNIRSLNKNIDELRLLFEHSIQSKFHIIGVSEVWNVTNPGILGIKGYTLELNCRDAGMRGGGVGAYIHSSMKYKVLNGHVLHAESIWIEIEIDKKALIIGVIYRKPNTDVTEFQNSLTSTLETMKVDKTCCALMGDFNINIQNQEPSVDRFVTSLNCMGLQQLIKESTRVTNSSASLIDHIYTNMLSNHIHAGVIVTDITDHFPIFAIFDNGFKSKPQQEKLIYRNYIDVMKRIHFVKIFPRKVGQKF